MIDTDAPAKPPDAPMTEETSAASQGYPALSQKDMKAVSALLRERFSLGR